MVDLAGRSVLSTIAVDIWHGSLRGVSPNHLALSPDGQSLLVSAAGTNSVEVFDVVSHEHVGSIPTAWYPTGIATSGVADQLSRAIVDMSALRNDFKAVFTVSYTVPGGVTLDYTGSVLGPMRLPEYDPPFQRATRSPTYSIHNLQGTLELGGDRQLYASVKNLFDWTQGSPLVDPAHPFGDDFDTAYVYGPVYGRQFVVGVRLAGGR